MRTRPWITAGLVLGFGLGGFLDGILLHQVLQWHHLLSLVPGVDDLRAQVLWDGWFHIATYLVTALGLWGLWRAHRGGVWIDGRVLLGVVLVGSGAWHVVDAFLSHWILGIHRIRLDVERPLLWDLGWLAAFGLLPIGIGLAAMRRGGPGGGGRRRAGLVALTALAIGAGGWAARPPAEQRFTTVVFRPGLDAGGVLAALAAVDAALVWSDSAMGVVVVAVDPRRRWAFWRHGAVLVGGAGVPVGCAGWVAA